MNDNIKIKPQSSYLGIPRKEIHWFPSIDYKKCNINIKNCFYTVN